jgi:CubicO group peptidase (beta-lactamase class C family)
MAIDKSNPTIKAALELLDARLADTQEFKQIPGIAVAVVLDQEIIFSRGYGYANLEKKTPMTTQHVFRVGSITKLFTATMMMQLRDAGKLCLDDPIEKYVPAFHIKSNFPDSRPPTFRMVVSHTAGIPVESSLNVWADLKFPPIQVFLEKLSESEIIVPAYTQIKYSNLGISILGHALEVIAKKPYREYIKEHILDPLLMNNSSFDLTPEMEAHLATGYMAGADGALTVAPIFDMGGMTPAGQLYSTVEDLAIFIMLQYRDKPTGGAQILGGTSLREMRSPVFMTSSETDPGVGIGWFLEKTCEKHTHIGHTGAVHGYSSHITLVPDLKLGLAFCINSMKGDDLKISNDAIDSLASLVARLTDEQEIVEQRKAAYRPEWEPYLGEYLLFGRKIFIKVLDNMLTMSMLGDEAGARNVLLPEGEHTFRVKGPAADGEKLVFIFGKEGKVKEVRVGGYVMERIS